MNILFVGDVVGRSGRQVLARHLPGLRDEFQLDFIIVNAENAAGGFGITEPIARQLLELGIDVLTSGNHIWDKREALLLVQSEPRLLRPHNYPDGTPGSGWLVAASAGEIEVGILNLMGTVFMNPTLDCPFQCADDALTADRPAVTIVDFHAEASSEKVAMGWHLDGRVSAVLGSHTHVPTADERVLPEGTAFISDAGMTGCYDSIIGMNKEKVLTRFVDKIPERFEVAKGPGTLCGVVIDVDENSGKSRRIERVARRD